MFRKLVNICINGQTAILGELGIKYNTEYGSDYIYSNTTGKLLEEFKKTGKLEEDAEGRLVLNQAEYELPMKAPYLVLPPCPYRGGTPGHPELLWLLGIEPVEEM